MEEVGVSLLSHHAFKRAKGTPSSQGSPQRGLLIHLANMSMADRPPGRPAGLAESREEFFFPQKNEIIEK